MKKILLPFLILPFICFCQEKKKSARPYVNTNFGVYKFKDTNVMGQASLSVGGHIKDLGIGVGAAITRFPGDKTNYIPIFFEVNLMPRQNKISPYGNIRLGSAIYRTPVAAVETRAGMYGAIQFGAAFPVAKTAKLLLGIGYIRPTFRTDMKVGGRVTTAEQSLDGFSAFMGFVL